MEMQNDITLEYYSNKPIWYLEYFLDLCGITPGSIFNRP